MATSQDVYQLQWINALTGCVMWPVVAQEWHIQEKPQRTPIHTGSITRSITISITRSITRSITISITGSITGSMTRSITGYITVSIMLFMLFLFLFTEIYLFPILSKFNKSIKDTVKYAFILSMKYLPYSLVIMVISSIFIVLTVIFPFTILFMIFVGVAFYAYISSYLFGIIFKKSMLYLEDV